jgi:hypothetical protein
MKTTIEVLFVISIFGFILSYFAYAMLKTEPDNSKVGKLIKKYKKHYKKFGKVNMVFLILSMILVLILNNVV